MRKRTLDFTVYYSPLKLVCAKFYYMQEALDYCFAAIEKGSRIWLRSTYFDSDGNAKTKIAEITKAANHV